MCKSGNWSKKAIVTIITSIYERENFQQASAYFEIPITTLRVHFLGLNQGKGGYMIF